MSGELRALTGARGVAAWWVVLYHIRLSIAGLPPALLAVLAKGYLAVDFFFLLSGFVMALSWGERLRGGIRGLALASPPNRHPGRGPGSSMVRPSPAAGRAQRWTPEHVRGDEGGWRHIRQDTAEWFLAVRAFWWKRVARVWPLHLAMLAAALALALVLVATGRADSAAYPLAELPLHVLLLQNWGFTDHPTWNVPAWSISAEAGAYLLFPLLVVAIDGRGRRTWTLLAILAALFLTLHAVMASAGASGLGRDIGRFGLLRCLVEFTAGMIVFALWARWRDRRGLAAISGALFFAGIAAVAAGVLPETLGVPPAFAAGLLALALSAGARGHLLESRPFHWLGEISYATYLAHFLLFVAFKLAFVSDPRAIPVPLVALYLATVLAASWALHNLVERPARLWTKSLPRRLRGRRDDMPAAA